MPYIKSCSTVLGVNSIEVLGSSQLFYSSKIETISNIWNLLTLSYKKHHAFPDDKFSILPLLKPQAGWAAGENEHSQPQIEV